MSQPVVETAVTSRVPIIYGATKVLLHGFPASSHQYRDLIPALADSVHDPATYGYTDAERPKAHRVQLNLFYDYGTNLALYPKWQRFLRWIVSRKYQQN